MDDKNQENNLISSEENDTTQEKDLISSEDVLAVVSGDSVALIEQLERAKEVAAEQLKNSQNTSQSELAKKKLEEELKKREAELAEAKRRRAEAKRKEQLAHEEEERKKLAIEAENKRRIEERQKKDAEEKARIEREKLEQEQKRLAKENEKKAKEAARQAEIQKREEAKKAKIEAREAARKAKEEAKKAMLQQQEIDKKAKIEAREAARKAKEEAKKARLQQQEADKKAKIEAREAARKAKEEARKAKIQKREEAKKAKIAAKEAARNKKKEPKANKVSETPVAKAPVVPVQPKTPVPSAVPAQPKPAVQQAQPAPQVTNPAPVSKPVASNSQVTSQQTVSAAPKVAQNLQAQNTEAGKAAKAATNVKAPKKESNFKYYMTAFLFIALILMVIFLPDISSFVSNYFAEKRAQEVPALTTGTLTCTLNTSDDRYDYYYQADFNFRDSQLYRLTYNTTIKGDQNLDAVELAEMEASCNLLKSQTANLDGINVSCSLSNGVVENEQVLSYENIDVELLTTAYLEAGGTYPNYRYQQNIDEIEKDMNASNYTCERHS